MVYSSTMSALKRKHKSNEVVVNNKSNFKSHLQRSQEILDNTHFDELVLKAMGKATTRAVNLALQLNKNNFNTFEIKPNTYCVEIFQDKTKRLKGANKDGFDPDSVNIEDQEKAFIPAIEIVVRKNRVEIDMLNQSRRKDRAQSISIGIGSST